MLIKILYKQIITKIFLLFFLFNQLISNKQKFTHNIFEHTKNHIKKYDIETEIIDLEIQETPYEKINHNDEINNDQNVNDKNINDNKEINIKDKYQNNLEQQFYNISNLKKKKIYKSNFKNSVKKFIKDYWLIFLITPVVIIIIITNVPKKYFIYIDQKIPHRYKNIFKFFRQNIDANNKVIDLYKIIDDNQIKI